MKKTRRVRGENGFQPKEQNRRKRGWGGGGGEENNGRRVKKKQQKHPFSLFVKFSPIRIQTVKIFNLKEIEIICFQNEVKGHAFTKQTHAITSKRGN